MLHTPFSSPPYLHLHLLHVPTQFNSSLTHVENYIVNMYRRRHFSIVFHLSTLSTYLQTCPFYVIFMLLWFSIHGTRFEVRTTSTISLLPPPFAFQQLNTELLTTWCCISSRSVLVKAPSGENSRSRRSKRTLVNGQVSRSECSVLNSSMHWS